MLSWFLLINFYSIFQKLKSFLFHSDHSRTVLVAQTIPTGQQTAMTPLCLLLTLTHISQTLLQGLWGCYLVPQDIYWIKDPAWEDLKNHFPLKSLFNSYLYNAMSQIILSKDTKIFLEAGISYVWGCQKACLHANGGKRATIMIMFSIVFEMRVHFFKIQCNKIK